MGFGAVDVPSECDANALVFTGHSCTFCVFWLINLAKADKSSFCRQVEATRLLISRKHLQGTQHLTTITNPPHSILYASSSEREHVPPHNPTRPTENKAKTNTNALLKKEVFRETAIHQRPANY